MLKKIFFGFIAVAGLASCNSDYKNWESPQSNPQHELASMQYTVTLATSSCVVDNFAEGDSIQMLNVSTGDNVTIPSYTLELNGGNDASYNVYASAAGKVAVDDLSAAAIYLFDRQVVARELLCNVWATAKVTTDDGVVDVPVHATDSQTISITPRTSKYGEWYYIVGNSTGWGFDAVPSLRSPNNDGEYTGYAYLDGGFKVAPGKAWGGDFGYYAFTTLSDNITASDDGNLVVDAGVYYIEMSLVTNSMKVTKITNMNIVGSLNGWNQADDSMQMAWDAAKGAYVKTVTVTSSEQFKFTANNAWTLNFGGNDNVEPSTMYNDLVQGGKNLAISEGTWTISLYPGRINTEYVYCTIEPAQAED